MKTRALLGFVVALAAAFLASHFIGRDWHNHHPSQEVLLLRRVVSAQVALISGDAERAADMTDSIELGHLSGDSAGAVRQIRRAFALLLISRATAEAGAHPARAHNDLRVAELYAQDGELAFPPEAAMLEKRLRAVVYPQ